MARILSIVPGLRIDEVLECKRAVMYLLYGQSVGSQSCLLSPAEDLADIFTKISFISDERLYTSPSREEHQLDTIIEAEVEESKDLSRLL